MSGIFSVWKLWNISTNYDAKWGIVMRSWSRTLCVFHKQVQYVSILLGKCVVSFVIHTLKFPSQNIKWSTGVWRESKGEGGAVKMLDILFPLFSLSLQEANLVPDPAPTLDIFAKQVLYKFTVWSGNEKRIALKGNYLHMLLSKWRTLCYQFSQIQLVGEINLS